MAESVDALVSNTSGAIRAGSTPAQGTEEETAISCLLFFLKKEQSVPVNGLSWHQWSNPCRFDPALSFFGVEDWVAKWLRLVA